MTSTADELAKLDALRQSGVITDAEFAGEKARLLGPPTPSGSGAAEPVENSLQREAFAIFRFADYDGGMPSHPQPEASGTFDLTKDGKWQFHPDGTASRTFLGA